MTEKDARLADFCRSGDYDGILIRRRSNIAWVTDGADVHCDSFSELGVATLLWAPGRKIVFTDTVDGPRLRAEEFSDDWEVVEAPWFETPSLPCDNVATDYPVDCLKEVRASLTEVELTRIRELGADTAQTVECLAKEVDRGVSEQEVAGRLLAALRRRGILAPVVLIGADDRIDRFRHPVPTANRLEKRLLVVVCARRRGLTVALTRLVHFGPVSEDLRCRHNAVCRVDEAYHTATSPGAQWGHVLSAGLQAYADYGFADEWQKHFQGGPMGYEGRDFWAVPGDTRRVAVNQAVGWNPSITGTKSEDTILSSGEVITASSDWPMNGRRPDILIR
ncbi:MAG: M24 family metallopeptidase [bacterium]|nr:M24 family metallopeptidase [bacterium]